MNDPITVGAQAAAERLSSEYGPGLAADVVAVLHTRRTRQRPEQYFDPISLATLIVSIATLAWEIYTGRRKDTPSPSTEVVTRTLRVELSNRGDPLPANQDKIIDIVVTEVIRAAGDPQ